MLSRYFFVPAKLIVLLYLRLSRAEKKINRKQNNNYTFNSLAPLFLALPVKKYAKNIGLTLAP
jgi:hypothetical protein